MSSKSPWTTRPGRGPGSAFLLAQIGARAAVLFAVRVAELDLTPAQAGLLRAVGSNPGRSQKELAHHLGTPPTRLVALVDTLEQRDLLRRSRNPADRRHYELHLTEHGQELLGQIGGVARAHDQMMTTALDASERDQLHALLTKIAAEQQLTSGVHPGYRTVAPTAVEGQASPSAPANPPGA